MTTHTPGPWEPSNGYVVVGDATIARCLSSAKNDPDADEAMANARLIATAPELLHALEEMLSIFGDHEQYDDDSAAVVRQARAAVAKAEGK